MSGEHVSRSPLQTRVNDGGFKDYHLLRAEMRILSDAAAEPVRNPPASVPQVNCGNIAKLLIA